VACGYGKGQGLAVWGEFAFQGVVRLQFGMIVVFWGDFVFLFYILASSILFFNGTFVFLAFIHLFIVDTVRVGEGGGLFEALRNGGVGFGRPFSEQCVCVWLFRRDSRATEGQCGRGHFCDRPSRVGRDYSKVGQYDDEETEAGVLNFVWTAN